MNVREKPVVERDSWLRSGKMGLTNEDGPRPIALTVGSSRGLAELVRSSTDA